MKQMQKRATREISCSFFCYDEYRIQVFCRPCSQIDFCLTSDELGQKFDTRLDTG